MHFYTHEDVKKAVTLGKLKIMKHPNVPLKSPESFKVGLSMQHCNILAVFKGVKSANSINVTRATWGPTSKIQ